MLFFRLPRGLCQHINSIVRKIWWGIKDGQRRTCLVAWSDMTKPRYMGGLGFRDIELFDLALLVHQAWRIMQSPESLSARILMAKYYPWMDLLSANLGSHPSQIWLSIFDDRDILQQGIIRRIGMGEETNPCLDNWLPREGSMRPVACIGVNPPSRVSEFINSKTMTWGVLKLRQFFILMDIEIIQNIRLCTRWQSDFWAWNYDRKAIFTVHSAYKMLVHTREIREAVSIGASNRHKEERQRTSL